MNVLVVDVGGTHVKILATDQETPREFASEPSLTTEEMVSRVLKAGEDWKYEAVSISYPGPVLRGPGVEAGGKKKWRHYSAFLGVVCASPAPAARR